MKVRQGSFGMLLVLLVFLFVIPSNVGALPIASDTALTLGFESNVLRSFARITRKSDLLKEGNAISGPENNKVIIYNTPLIVPIRLSPSLVLTAIVPILNITSEKTLAGFSTKNSASGIGDVQLLVKKAFFKKDGLKRTMRFAWKAGLKLPTGDEDKSPALGNGSVDFIVGGLFTLIVNRYAMHHDLSYKINTEANGLRAGNQLRYNIALEYRMLPETFKSIEDTTLNFIMEFNSSYEVRSKNKGQSLVNTGGASLFLSPGFQAIVSPRLILEALFQYPILQELNGTQLGIDYTTFLGFRYSF